MLYPDSSPESATTGKFEPEPEPDPDPEPAAPVIADVKDFNEPVNCAIIDSAGGDDSAGKLIVVIWLFLCTNIY